MGRTLRQYFIFTGQSIIFWILALYFLVIVRYLGVFEEKGVSILPKYELSIFEMFQSALIVAVPFGIFYAGVEFLFDRFLSKRLALGITILTKTLIYLLTLISLLTFLIEYTGYILDAPTDTDPGWWRTNKTFWAIVFFFMIGSLVFSFIKIANEKFGNGVFIKMLLGKYRKPQEEKRIFMFLDLQSSTTIAEKLGHYTYSQLIQDCFYDLNDVVPKYEAEIYQYVGDEAVLSWSYKKGIKRANVVNLFFAYQNKLLSRNKHYQEKYGMLPTFKAGIHGGILMVTEVGTIKKELAYHGDVINTTARIQSQCNTYNASLLSSESLLEDLKLPEMYTSDHIGDLLLKGKSMTVNIFNITAKTKD